MCLLLTVSPASDARVNEILQASRHLGSGPAAALALEGQTNDVAKGQEQRKHGLMQFLPECMQVIGFMIPP